MSCFNVVLAFVHYFKVDVTLLVEEKDLLNI
jgi:hypothetical protein